MLISIGQQPDHLRQPNNTVEMNAMLYIVSEMENILSTLNDASSFVTKTVQVAFTIFYTNSNTDCSWVSQTNVKPWVIKYWLRYFTSNSKKGILSLCDPAGCQVPKPYLLVPYQESS